MLKSVIIVALCLTAEAADARMISGPTAADMKSMAALQQSAREEVSGAIQYKRAAAAPKEYPRLRGKP